MLVAIGLAEPAGHLVTGILVAVELALETITQAAAVELAVTVQTHLVLDHAVVTAALVTTGALLAFMSAAVVVVQL
jgi:hypothetical protein